MSTNSILLLGLGFVILVVFLVLSNSKDSSTQPTIDLSNLPSWSPIIFNNPGMMSTPTYNDTPLNYSHYPNYGVDPITFIGSPIPNSTPTSCQIACTNTPTCVGFEMTGGKCQLTNDVAIINRKFGGDIYASQDIGAMQYMHVPYTMLQNDAQPKKLYTFTGPLGDAVSNCNTVGNNCGAFTSTGANTYDMYPVILAVDSKIPGNTYYKPDSSKQLQFIKEGNFRYTDTPDKTFTIDVSKILPNPLPTFKKDMDFFHIWGQNWDVGIDTSGSPQVVLHKSGPDACANVCMTTSGCQSFVVGKGAEDGSCWTRQDLKEEYLPQCGLAGWRCPPAPTVGGSAGWCLDTDFCPDGPASCGATAIYRSCASSSSTRDTYYKYQQPIDVQCPGSCMNNDNCQMVTYDSTQTCNQYKTPVESHRVADSTMTAVWNATNFPL